MLKSRKIRESKSHFTARQLQCAVAHWTEISMPIWYLTSHDRHLNRK